MESLQRRANRIVVALNGLEGVTCNVTQGALYAFPSITLPQGAVDRAKELGKAPDAYYCLELLDHTGIVVVPGSGFGQASGTWHFRTTILPQEEHFDDVIERMSTFHQQFLDRFR
jgi:alanine transaminase